MKALLTFFLLCTSISAFSSHPINDNCNHQLYYTTPATIWEETLPLGNGRLGMMPDGGIACEHIVLNEISLWSGMETDYSNPNASKDLPAIQQLLLEGKNKEAQQLMYKSFVPKTQGTKGKYGTYQTLGDLNINFDYTLNQSKPNVQSPPTDYHRSLSLRDAIAYTSFTQNGINYKREYFVSRNKDVMLIHLTANHKGALNFAAQLSRAKYGTVTVDGSTLLMTGTLENGTPQQDGMNYRVAMQLISKTGKQTVTAESGISLKNGQEAWLVLSATTSYTAKGTCFPGERYVTVCDSLLKTIHKTSSLKATHISAHRALYDRVTLTLPASADDTLPTNERIIKFAQQESPALAALYYNYGRYLLISSTRPGSLPPNLQGLWANTLQTPWNGDYHANINVQMNHWPLEQANLPELYQPLISMVDRLIPSGEKTARAFYGDKAEGWVLHMKTNAWNFTAPGEHPSWGATNTGGAWLCANLWEHYLYTQDVNYLRQIYPILKGAAKFFSSTTIEEPRHGWLVTAPTSSPENSFYMPGDRSTPISVCMGPTMDVQLLTELYKNIITSARLLNCDTDYAARLEADLKKFPPMQISKEGYLQEWLEDYREVDIHHRHVSHLYGLHPSNLISPDATPELAEACRTTLNRRGDGGTGWSRAWKINFWARLHDGNRAWKLFKSLLYPAIDTKTGKQVGGTLPNLFCSHPPFQIDGNYGGTAGVGEMVLQSHEGFIHLLPALPDSWKEGSFRGMRVRGGASVDLDWKNGHATKAVVKAMQSGKFKVRMPQKVTTGKVTIGKTSNQYTEKIFTLTLQKGEIATIEFK